MRYYRYDLDQITAILDLGAHSLHSLHRPAPFLSLSLSLSLSFSLPRFPVLLVSFVRSVFSFRQAENRRET